MGPGAVPTRDFLVASGEARKGALSSVTWPFLPPASALWGPSLPDRGSGWGAGVPGLVLGPTPAAPLGPEAGGRRCGRASSAGRRADETCPQGRTAGLMGAGPRVHASAPRGTKCLLHGGRTATGAVGAGGPRHCTGHAPVSRSGAQGPLAAGRVPVWRREGGRGAPRGQVAGAGGATCLSPWLPERTWGFTGSTLVPVPGTQQGRVGAGAHGPCRFVAKPLAAGSGF